MSDLGRGEKLQLLDSAQLPTHQKVSAGTLKSVLRAVERFSSGSGTCWASIASLSAITCIKDRQIRNALSALCSLKILLKDSRQGLTDCYQIQWDELASFPQATPATFAAVQQVEPRQPLHEPRQPLHEPRQRESEPRQPLPTNRKNRNESERIGNTSSKMMAGEFDQFWKLVGRKEGKTDARKAFIKARKSYQLDHILDMTRRYYGCFDGNLRYAKHPTTFLNQCLEDDPSEWVKPRSSSRRTAACGPGQVYQEEINDQQPW